MGLTAKEAKQLNDSKTDIRFSWARACNFEGVAADASFVVFSNNNPHATEHNTLMLAHAKLVNRIKRNIARRERTEMLKDLGVRRVKGALGGVYYE